jgi:hypothetical protein
MAAGSKMPVAKGMAALVEDLPSFGYGFSWGYDDLWSERRAIGGAGVAMFTQPGCVDATVLIRAPGFGRRRLPWTNGAREVAVAIEPEAVVRGEVQFKRKATSG